MVFGPLRHSVLQLLRNSLALSLNDKETVLRVKSLTSDKLAECINDGSFTHTEDYVRFMEAEF